MTESVGVVPAGLETLNGQPTTEAEERLRTCCAARRWIARMIAGRPYGDVDSLLKRSDEAFRDLGPGDVAEAMASHPRIGQRVAGPSTEAAWSRQEQAAMTDADAEIRAALHDRNVAYEERFGQVFLIRAAGRTPTEMLAELRRRLGNDPETEHAEMAEQLRQITRLRLERLLQS